MKGFATCPGCGDTRRVYQDDQGWRVFCHNGPTQSPYCWGPVSHPRIPVEDVTLDTTPGNIYPQNMKRPIKPKKPVAVCTQTTAIVLECYPTNPLTLQRMLDEATARGLDPKEVVLKVTSTVELTDSCWDCQTDDVEVNLNARLEAEIEVLNPNFDAQMGVYEDKMTEYTTLRTAYDKAQAARKKAQARKRLAALDKERVKLEAEL